MIKVTSNINEFLKHYKKRVVNFKVVLDSLAEKLAKRMADDMKNLIQSDKRWQEHGNLSRINDVDFRIEPLSENSVRVHIGENLPKFTMTDGKLVNPAFFIEFGFGIVGQSKPKENHEKYQWEYNIRGHKDSWLFWYEGILMESEGREGINFIYNTIDKYRVGWKYYLKELLEEQANGGI
jgi:hypothetical protein